MDVQSRRRNILLHQPHRIDTIGHKKVDENFDEEGVRSIFKEMKQFYDREVVKPLKPRDITHNVKYRALVYLMFLKMKISR